MSTARDVCSNLYIGGIVLVLVSAGVVAAKAIGRHDSAADAVRRRRHRGRGRSAGSDRARRAVAGSRTLTFAGRGAAVPVGDPVSK